MDKLLNDHNLHIFLPEQKSIQIKPKPPYHPHGMIFTVYKRITHCNSLCAGSISKLSGMH